MEIKNNAYICTRNDECSNRPGGFPETVLTVFVMAYSFGTVTAEMAYKGHRIETTESPMQIVYVVDGDREHAYWSIADAKRAINGKELKCLPVDVRHWFR